MKTWKIVAGLLGVWVVVMMYMSMTVMQSGEANQLTEHKLKQALNEMDRLKSQNEDLKKLALDLKDLQDGKAVKNNGNSLSKLQLKLERAKKELKELTEKNPDVDKGVNKASDVTPTLEHEKKRRKLETTTQEFWFYIRSELNKLKSLVKEGSSSQLDDRLNKVLDTAFGYQKTLYSDLYQLRNLKEVADWRRQESKALGDLVQKRFTYLQNPSDCATARKVVCNLHKGCGYGCQLHHVVYCFIVAYATKRTLVLESKGWRYAARGWESVFLPLSNTCLTKDGTSTKHWGPPNMIKDAQVLELPIVDSMHPKPDFMPLAIPADLAHRLVRLHGDPAVWWIGQIVRYLTRPQKVLSDDMENTAIKLGFKHPIVGIHVRRTDKVGVEAAFHSIEEYMLHVEEYYNKRAMVENITVRRVYLASDDSSVLAEARKKFPNYVFISDNEVSKTAGLGTRYTDASLRGIILDTHFLSLCDYLVCTFSSQVCRVGYEIMQTIHGDASQYFYSLDDVYYFGGQNAHNMVAIEQYSAKELKEMDLEVGDLVGIAGNHWDGFSKGLNRRSGRSGLYPSYKVENKVVVAEMPTYSEVDDVS